MRYRLFVDFFQIFLFFGDFTINIFHRQTLYIVNGRIGHKIRNTKYDIRYTQYEAVMSQGNFSKIT